METSIIKINSNPSSFLPKLAMFCVTSPNRDGFWRKQQITSLPHFPAPLPLGDMNKSEVLSEVPGPPAPATSGFFPERHRFWLNIGWKYRTSDFRRLHQFISTLKNMNPMNQSPGISNSYKSWSFCDSDNDFFRMLLRLMTFYPGHHSPQYKGMKMSIGKSSSQPSKEVASWFPRMIRWWFWRFTKDTKTHKRNRLNPPEKARSPQLLQLESLAPRKVCRIPNRRMLLVMGGILHQVVASLPVYPTIYRALYIPGGAGFLPSTVCRCLCMVPFAGCIKENILSNESWDSSPPASTTMEI